MQITRLAFIIASIWFGTGRWYADLSLSPGTHTSAATANYTEGNLSATATSGFSVVGNNAVTNFYDASGNVTNRPFASGKTQTLTWDSAGRLLSVVQRENATNGFNWTAIYDALGRRLRTTQVQIVNGATNSVMPLTIDSLYDPQVEFGEVGVAVNGQRTWKIVGPDSDGHFGSMQGVGGIEATYRESDASIVSVVNDFFGNVPATISGSTVNWTATRVSGYGPEIGYEAPALTASTLLADTMVWRSRRADPSGLYSLGVRYYEPLAGRFLSSDPLGHAAAWDLYSFCNGDPLNRFDPTGRFGKDLLKGAAYGIGDFLDSFNQFFAGNTGPSYRSMLNGSVTSQVGYMLGYGAADATTQLAVYFALGGISSLGEGIAARGAAGAGMEAFTVRSIEAEMGLAEGAAAESEGLAVEAEVQVAGREAAAISGTRVGISSGSALTQSSTPGVPALSQAQIQSRVLANIEADQTATATIDQGLRAVDIRYNIAANRASTATIGKGLVTTDLRALTSVSAQRVDALGINAFTAPQQRAVGNYPQLFNAYRGSTIDAAVRDQVSRDPLLQFLQGRPNRGPDFIHEQFPGTWWDMTTPGQWPAHVTRYGPGGILLPTK
jgi:RHS repeat-associated protein